MPARTCVACRTQRDKASLLRVVRQPDGSVALDPSGGMPGRGAYLCPDPACWSLSLRRGSLQRALGAPLPPSLRMQFEQGLDPLQAGTAAVQGGAHGA